MQASTTRVGNAKFQFLERILVVFEELSFRISRPSFLNSIKFFNGFGSNGSVLLWFCCEGSKLFRIVFRLRL